MTDDRRPITAEDVNRLVSLEDPAISPDGRWIAYVHVRPDPFENTYQRNIWLVAAEGDSAPIQLTRSGKDSQPRWSPDGRYLAFTSARGERPQIFLLPVTAPGGEARQLTRHPNGATDPAWSPDGRQIAYLSRMNAEERRKEDAGEEPDPPQDPLAGKHRKEREEEDEKKRWDPRPMERIPYRAGTSYLDDRYTQIYVVAAEEGLDDEAAKPRRLTDVDTNHTPPRWSPDGTFLYTARAWDIEADEPFRFANLYRIRVADGELTRYEDETHAIANPKPSPDGSWVACVRRPGSETDAPFTLTLIPASGQGDPVELSRELDRSVYDYEWSGADRLIASVADHGDCGVYHFDVPAARAEAVLTGRFYVEHIAVTESGDVAYTASTPHNPCELFYAAVGAQQAVQKTAVNRDFLDGVIVRDIHEIHFQSPAGVEIQGWFLYPVGYEEGQQYPLALNIHGGPHVMWSHSTRTMWHEWQYHAARGYVVFFCNPRGGDGYGESFLKALHGDWGSVAMEDIMAGVDALIARGFVDEDHMAITGGSYGGYMTAWIIGHTDRFKAAVAQRGVYNLASFYGTSDVPTLISSEYDTEPWEDYHRLWEHSPLAYAHRITTPLLLIHAENDFRVPIEQAEQMFAYVRRSGGTVHMLRYPREGHELSRSGEPAHRVSRLEEMVRWFDRYCGLANGDQDTSEGAAAG